MKLERHFAVVTKDLPAIYAYIAADNPAAAERVLDAVELTFERLRQQPECGVVYQAVDAKLVGIRMLPVIGFENYLIFYRLDHEAVRILYVLHGAQDLPRLFRREGRA